MCTQFVPLTKSNDFRYILRCEHGAIYLTWDLVTVYLNLREFEGLARLLDQGTYLAESSKIVEMGCILIYSEQGYYRLWIQNIAISLKPVEFLILADMVRVALKGVQEKQITAPAATPALERFQGYQRTVTASANLSFSIN